MRFYSILGLFLPLFFAGCASEGVIVRKDSGPLPFYETIGVDGSYAFILRDRAGSMHRQLVSAEVFDRYAVGQYFNDQQPAAGHEERSSEDKEMQATSVYLPTERIAQIARTPLTVTTLHLVNTSPSPAAPWVAANVVKSHEPVAKRAATAPAKKNPIRLAKATPHKTQTLILVSVAR